MKTDFWKSVFKKGLCGRAGQTWMYMVVHRIEGSSLTQKTQLVIGVKYWHYPSYTRKAFQRKSCIKRSNQLVFLHSKQCYFTVSSCWRNPSCLIYVCLYTKLPKIDLWKWSRCAAPWVSVAWTQQACLFQIFLVWRSKWNLMVCWFTLTKTNVCLLWLTPFLSFSQIKDNMKPKHIHVPGLSVPSRGIFTSQSRTLQGVH